MGGKRRKSRVKAPTKVCVSSRFHQAMHELKRMKGDYRKHALARANDRFIRDLSHVTTKVRNQPPDLSKVNPRLLKRLQFQRKNFNHLRIKRRL